MNVARLRLAALVVGLLAAGPAFASGISVQLTTLKAMALGYTLTVKPVATGGALGGVTAPSTPDAVACSLPSTACASNVTNGQVVVLTATPGANSAFQKWGGVCSGTSPTCTVTMNMAKSVSAYFVRASWNVTAAFYGATGTITGTGVNCAYPGTGDCVEAVALGGSIALTATPDAMSSFTGWGGCTSVAGNVCTVTAPTSNKTVTAGFAAKACNSCHGTPPPPPHVRNTNCGGCHQGYTISTVTSAHLNGAIDVTFVCGACHGTPPTDHAHALHSGAPLNPSAYAYGDLGILEDFRPGDLTATEYMFGCGYCHPLDSSRHMDGTVQVEVTPNGAPAGSLRARNDPAAAYSGTVGETPGRCSGVWCHSSGQATPSFASSPAWNTTVPIACDGCHGNPPSYPSGGAGTATANTHVVVADDGWVLGHFAGLLGPWHTSYHGHGDSWGLDAAPITCQTCHFETVDPYNTGPSGFYYLDTSGNYALIDPATGQPAILYDACQTCHTGQAGAPPPGWGKVRPLRHVNGKRDVVFDARDLPLPLNGYDGAPTGSNTRPYWANLTYGAPGTMYPGAVYENGTWSVHLKDASYEPTTKTCSNVACHLRESRPPYPLVWGTDPVGSATCDRCHGYGGH